MSERAARHYGWWFGGVAWLAGIALLFQRPPLIAKDGFYYVLWLKSLFLEGQVNFDYNPFSVGPALLWSPFYWLAHGWASWQWEAGSLAMPNGSTGPYHWAIGIATASYGLTGAWLLLVGLRRLVGSVPAFWAVTAIFWATPVGHYVLVEPGMSHGLAFFAVSLFLERLVAASEEPTPAGALGIGMGLGLCALVRWQSAMVGLLALPFLAKAGWRERVAIVGMPLAMASVQFWAWKTVYGEWFLLPQGGGFLMALRPRVGEVLFSSVNGVFYWSPMLAMGLLGLVALAWQGRSLAKGSLAPSLFAGLAMGIFLAQTYLNSIVWDYWGGDSFGGRRFVSLAPLLAAGLGWLFAWALKAEGRAWRWPERKGDVLSTVTLNVAILCAAWSLLLHEQYLDYQLPREEPFALADVARNLQSDVEFLFAAEPPPEDEPESARIPLDGPPVTEFGVDFGDDDYSEYLGPGWSAVTEWAGITSAWAMGTRSEVRVAPLQRAHQVRWRAAPFLTPAQGPQRVQVALDGRAIGEVDLLPGMREYQLPLPPDVSTQSATLLSLEHRHAHVARNHYQESPSIGQTGVFPPSALALRQTSLQFGYDANIYADRENLSLEKRGYNLAVIDPETGFVWDRTAFDCRHDPKQAQAMLRYLRKAPEGFLVAFALKSPGVYASSTLGALRDRMESLRERFLWETENPALGMRNFVLYLQDSVTEGVARWRRWPVFESVETYDRCLRWLRSYDDETQVSLVIERTEEPVDAVLAEAFALIGVEAYPYLPAGIGVRGAPVGSGHIVAFPTHTNTLLAATSQDDRELAAAYDWLIIEPRPREN